jgi:hypothetical protein
MTVLFNSGYFQGSTAKTMATFKNPMAWFLGGPKDIAQKNVSPQRFHYSSKSLTIYRAMLTTKTFLLALQLLRVLLRLAILEPITRSTEARWAKQLWRILAGR